MLNTYDSIPNTLPSEPLSKVRSVLQTFWGYDSFRPLQQEAMLSGISNQDSLVVLPTGGGKSLCFQAPALCLDGMALVVSPLISLMKDQVDALRACGIQAAFINSSLSSQEKRDVLDQIQRRELKLLYIAPERLLADRTLSYLQTAGISMVAIDEAHCISAWGHDFRPEYRGLSVLKSAFPSLGIHAYTATASQRVQSDIVQQLRLEQPRILIGSFDRPNLVYRILPANEKFRQVCEIVDRHRGESGIIYCISRKEVERMAASLKAMGLPALPYHAGLDDQLRKRNQNTFIQDDKGIMVATVAFGMGIDKSNVRYVVHAGMPKSLEHYQQESGRAGRDGLEAECCLIHSVGDLITWKKLMPDNDPAATQALDAMHRFCLSGDCRHRSIVRYFGQELENRCGSACDVCLGEVAMVDDPIKIGQMILSCVLRLKERFGADYTAKVLTGSEEARIISAGHHQLSTYGLMKNHSVAELRSWMEQLVGLGYLRRTEEYQLLEVSDLGRELLKGKADLQLTQPVAKNGASKRQSHESWEGVDRDLFESLREKRSQIALARSVPAYVIFADSVLRDLAKYRPSNLACLQTIKGVGEKKLADFGQEFLDVLNEYCLRNPLQRNVPAAESIDEASIARKPSHSMASAASFEMFRQRLSIDEVANKMQRAKSTVTGYLNDYIVQDKITDPSPWVARDIASRIEMALEQLGQIDRLRDLFDHLGGEVAYSDIRIVWSCYNNRR